MTHTLKPETADGVCEAVRWALAEGSPLDVAGMGSKRRLGRPAQQETTLDLSGLSGITLYEPEELVLSARAGTPMAEIEALLDRQGQALAFEPMDFGPLLGEEPGAGTIGAALAVNLAGPRRIKSGAARDHVLGINAVSGRGENFKSGGRVVKNVTGYDLSKGLAGSFGTLAVVTDVTFKVLPKPETSQTLVVAGLSDAEAVAVMTGMMGTSADVSGAAHLPADAAGALVATRDTGGSATLIRLEGVAPSVRERADRLAADLAAHGEVFRLDDGISQAAWRDLRDVRPLCGADERAVWRISTAPSAGASIVSAFREIEPGAAAFYDWSGGLVWLAVPEGQDAGAADLRAAIRRAGGGHATLVRGSPALRGRVDVFEPLAPPLAALARRLKDQFDPRGVLNPGRMYAGH